MLQLDLVDKCCQAIHVRLTMMQSVLFAHNASSQLVTGIKGTFMESLNTRMVTLIRMVTWVSMVNQFWLNGMEAQPSAQPSAQPPAPFCGTEPAVYNHSSYQTQLKCTFDPLTHQQCSWNTSIQFVSDLYMLHPWAAPLGFIFTNLI